MKTIHTITQILAWSHRERVCRKGGHTWSERTDPLCCGRCGCTRTYRSR